MKGGQTDRPLLQLDHGGNERTSLVSDVKLNWVDWGYVQSTQQRAGRIPNTDQKIESAGIFA